MTHSRHNRQGLTLVEVIVTIVLVAVLGALLVTLLGDKLIGGTEPVAWTSRESAIETTMERVIADYVRLVNDDANIGSDVLAMMQANAAAGDYGQGVTMSYIGFAGGTESPGGNFLKVEVTDPDDPGHVLTVILSNSRTDASDSKVNY